MRVSLHSGPWARLVVERRDRRFEAVLAQSKIELIACDPQPLRRLRFVATDLAQYAHDRASLQGVEIHFAVVDLRTATGPLKRQMRSRDGVVFADDDRPLEGVVQFAHVAWPRMG